LVPQGDEHWPAVECSASDRLLMLWGRRPADGGLDLADVTAPHARHLIAEVLFV
jgi:hypothetical protein